MLITNLILVYFHRQSVGSENLNKEIFLVQSYFVDLFKRINWNYIKAKS